MSDDNEDFHGGYKADLGKYVKQARNWASQDEGPASQSGIFRELSSVPNRYHGDKTLAEGGMKRILNTRDQATGRSVAKAVLHPGATAEEAEQFLREARITAQLQHPNIIPVYDIGVDDEECPYFTMKLIAGDSLQDILDQLARRDPTYEKKFPLTTLLDIYLHVCDAVAYAHSKGVVHLDLKPANIQVSEFGEVLLCDWGLAKVLDEDCTSPDIIRYSLNRRDLNNLTVDGFIKGSPGYMAPEQASGRAGEKKKYTDIYALGAVLYTFLTGHQAIETRDVDEYIKRCCAGDIAPPAQRFPKKSIPRGLEAVCMKALALDPQQRYQSVGDLANEIRAFRMGFATEAEDADFLTHARLLVMRHGAVSSVVGLAILILFLLSALFVVRLNASRKRAESALADLRLEQEQRQKLGKETALSYLRQARDAIGAYQYQNALDKVTAAVSLDPDLSDARLLRGDILFILQQYEEAEEAYMKCGTRAFARLTLTRELRRTGVQPGKAIPDAAAVFSSIQKIVPPSLYHHATMQIVLAAPDDPTVRAEYVRNLLKLDNPQAAEFQFEYDAKTNAAAVRNGRGFLNPRAIRGLSPRNLDLTGTDVADLTCFRDMRFAVLNLSHTHVADLRPLANTEIEELNLGFSDVTSTSGLSELKAKKIEIQGCRTGKLPGIEKNTTLIQLTVGPGQLPQEVRARLPDRVHVVVDDSDPGFMGEGPPWPGGPPFRDGPPRRGGEGPGAPPRP